MTRRRPLLRASLMATVLAAGGAYAVASYDWCGRWTPEEPQLEAVGLAQGPLLAGAAKVAIAPPYPVVIAGYAPPRPKASQARLPLYARALVLQVEAVKVALVSLEVLTAPAAVTEEIRDKVARLGFGEVWVVATHSHSSMGGYDPRTVSQLAGTGRYREENRAALVEAAVLALGQAEAALAPASLELGEAPLPELTFARSGEAPDPRLTRASFTHAAGRGAELLIFSAHPTLVSGKAGELDPDWPGELAALWEQQGGVALVIQGGVGNSSVGDPTGGPKAFAARLFEAASQVALTPQEPTTQLGFGRASVALPRPDASRVPGVPSFLRAASDNFLCGSSPRRAQLSALRLGALSFVAVPVEPSFASAKNLEKAAGVGRSISLANGYLGYLEPSEVVAQGGGEAKRQYFEGRLEQVLLKGAALCGQALAQRP